MPDVLDEQHRQITDRLKELAPLVEEHRRLQAAAKALARIRRSAGAAVTTRRRKPGRASAAPKARTATPTKKPGRPKKVGHPATSGEATPVATPTAATKRRAGRRKGSGTRAAQTLALVKGEPGITIPELATKMGIKQNYLYRVLPALQKERKITKQGKGWYARGSRPSTSS